MCQKQEWSINSNYIIYSNGQIFSKYSNKFLKQFPNKGYLQVRLVISKGKQKTFKVHRLIAETFLSNPDDLPEVNHLDENPLNNDVSNLKWVTSKENANHGTRNIRIGKKKVIQCDLNTHEPIQIFNGVREAERILTNNPNAHSCIIGKVCNGQRKSAYGFY